MKKQLFCLTAAAFAFSLAFAQQVKNKQIYTITAADYTNAVAQKDVNDVSLKSPIRFDMHTTNGDQRATANMQHHAEMVAANPNYDAERNAYEQAIQNYISMHRPELEGNQMVYTLPIVVHNVYSNSTSQITLNQVLSQIQVLNEDFGRTNADANTHWSQAANTTIQFCLAQQDPNGAATTGLEMRQNTTTTTWSTNDNVKHYANGGLNAWDPTRYLNIWVCNLSGGLLGYGEFPTGTVSQTFGVVIDYSCFGSNYTSYGTFPNVASPFDRGRTVTHEFSHCFNLYHIWGDDGGACSGSDQCSDTPNQADATSGCYAYPHTDACSTTNPGIMFENYMDYSDDNCLNLFTAGQKTRMLAVLAVAPYNALTTSTACQAPSAVGDDAGISAITTPNGTICGLTFTPVVTLKNWGANTLTSVTIKYKIDNNALQTYSWSGSLNSGGTATVTLASMTTTAATHTFTCYTLNPNGNADANAANDQSTSNFTAVNGGQTLPFFEGFEGATFVPTGWTLNNPDAGVTWDRTTACAKTGAASARMNNWAYQGGNGQRDEMTTPAVDLSTVSSPVMTFQVAYTYWTVPYQFSDTLEVLVSTDCGTTWTTVYKKWGSNLQTAPPVSSTTAAFVPTASQWRLETVNLLPYQTSNALYVKFRNISDYEDNLYLDDINIMNSTDVPNFNLSNAVSLFPNPSTGMVTLNVSLGSQENLHVAVTNALGQTVQQFSEGSTYGGVYTLDLSNQANGVYFVQIQAGEERTTQRIVISR